MVAPDDAYPVWEREVGFWVALENGVVAEYVVHSLGRDATLIVPGRRLLLDEVVEYFAARPPAVTAVAITDRETLLVTDDTTVVAYRVGVQGAEADQRYDAQVLSVYVRVHNRWALAVTQHTPDLDVGTTWLPAPASYS